MARIPKTDDHSHAALEAEVAALRKEVAALKTQLSKRPAGGSGAKDPRIDFLVEWVKVAQLPSKLGGPEKRAKVLKGLGIK